MLLVLAILAAIFYLPHPWGLLAVAVAGLVEFLEIGVFFWLSKRRRPVTGVEGMRGSVATVVDPCDPVGRVLLAGELWRAECAEGAAANEQVVVERLGEDLTLIVKPFAANP